MKGDAWQWHFRVVVVTGGCLLSAFAAQPTGAVAGVERFVDFEPRLSLRETYSDGEVGSGNNSRGWVSSLTPGFKLQRQGSRAKTDIDYSLNNLYYHDDSEFDLRHRLGGSIIGEILQRELFIESRFSKRDQIISPLRATNIDSTLQRDNLTSGTTWSIGPRWEHRLGDVAISTLRYEVNRVTFSDNAADDSWGTSLNAGLNSGALFSDWFWSADYSKNDVRYSGEDGRDEFEMYSGTLGYNLTRKLNVYVTVGNENNQFRNSVGSTGGSYWSVGTGFSPSVRTSLNASIGKRFFGDTYSFALNHSARRWNATVSRSETITTTRQQQLGDIFLICPPEIPNCTPAEAIAFGVDIGVRNGTYIQKSLAGSVTYSLAKSAWTLSAFDQERTFRDGSGGDDQSSGATLGWNWRFGPRTGAHASTGWTQYQFSTGTATEVDRWFVRLGLDRELAPELKGSLNYSYQSRSSNGVADRNLKGGNTLSAQLHKTF